MKIYIFQPSYITLYMVGEIKKSARRAPKFFDIMLEKQENTDFFELFFENLH